MIEQLIDLFLDEGFADMSLSDLAGSLKCSKTTLYAVAPSKEQIIVAVVRAFFRRATERIESRMMPGDSALARLDAYLRMISEELTPGSQRFFADVDAFEPAREIFHNNTLWAAQRVQALVREALPAGSAVDALFVGTVASLIMNAIHRGEIEESTGMGRGAASRALADLIIGAITATGTSRPPQH
ncbi:TetR/AcrR family transcriptional regulator [Pseudarthrobacter sp. NIBRBAC000502772]|uniref:TetR/AcrR family transcriptional regulator n=1 Tax=Pseudarthrobacter sp. NIBRBAC000502772 TaxID=2590775 RepID=UPI00143D6349|nr:TetR/AcrR family transcriptional regulator [Pseudarthrobacter sp. NIBRBAC000502772]